MKNPAGLWVTIVPTGCVYVSLVDDTDFLWVMVAARKRYHKVILEFNRLGIGIALADSPISWWLLFGAVDQNNADVRRAVERRMQKLLLPHGWRFASPMEGTVIKVQVSAARVLSWAEEMEDGSDTGHDVPLLQNRAVQVGSAHPVGGQGRVDGNLTK